MVGNSCKKHEKLCDFQSKKSEKVMFLLLQSQFSSL